MDYDIHRPWLSLDKWQKEYIETKGNCFLLCGRQSGKSTAASIKFGKRAATNKKHTVLMLAFTENQAYLLFFKTLMYLKAVYPMLIDNRAGYKPTKHIINLRNGSKILCYAAGKFGEGVRGHTVDSLAVDEAAAMAREVFVAIKPMISITGGSIDLLSTPRGKAGYYYECSDDPSLGEKVMSNWTRFYVNGEDCPRHTTEFLQNEREALSDLEYAQEYKAEFLDDMRRVFSEEWIESVCCLHRPSKILVGRKYYLGVDIARMGEDSSTFEILQRTDKKNLFQVESIVTSKTRLTETEKTIIDLQELYKFRKIYIDAGSGSMGVSVLDHLLEERTTKRRVVAINNREWVQDDEETEKQKIMKEELYSNLLWLGEKGHIKLLDDIDIKQSLASVQFENRIVAGALTTTRIFGRDTHIAEGLIRAAWCVKDDSLSLWAR